VFKTSLDVEIEAYIDAPPVDVWNFVSDAERLPEWLEEFQRVVKETADPVGVGSVFRYTIEPGPRTGTIEIVEWQPGRRFAWDGPPLSWHGGGARPRGSFEVTADRGGTRFVSHYRPQLTGTMVLLHPYMKWWVRRQRTADTARMKELIEAGSAPRTAAARPGRARSPGS
jgi:uncharacterized protein YndB with AHSA1/START domain